jgi:hypothetical protein
VHSFYLVTLVCVEILEVMCTTPSWVALHKLSSFDTTYNNITQYNCVHKHAENPNIIVRVNLYEHVITAVCATILASHTKFVLLVCTVCLPAHRESNLLLEYNGCARFTIDNITIVTQP